MFYSHVFLARKGPLGTVWCAAHLQHKLKKSHYTSTDIPSTVERIMFPPLPIALRMSSHLLLGVVRIYSKKVDYLHHDCNSLWVSLRNAFRPVDVNLVETSTHAQFNAVTLPETCQLDTIDIDLNCDPSQDNHLKSQEEITITDQYSPERELYLRITIDDDTTSEASHQREIGNDLMQTDVLEEPVNAQTSEVRSERFEEGSSIPDILVEVEAMRDYQGITQDLPMEDELIAPTTNASPPKNTPEKESDFGLSENIVSPRLPLDSGPSAPPIGEASGGFDSFAHETPPDLSLRPSPPPEKPQRRQRKRKQFFDKELVLTNQFLKNALNDSSDLVKKRQKLPSSALDIWRFTNKKKKGNIFLESLTSGLCAELHSISVKTIPFSSEIAQPEEMAPESPERIRYPDDTNIMPELTPSPFRVMPQKTPETAQTSASPNVFVDPFSEPRLETTVGSDPDRAGSERLGTETLFSDFGLRINGSNAAASASASASASAGLSDIPELRIRISGSDELSFLEQDNNNYPDSEGPRESDAMSVRTRAVAQYLKSRSPSSDNSQEEVSLNQILEGRSRKLCARMFYETLVLKNYGLVNVKQDEPYGDITIKFTPALSKANI